MYTRRNKLGRVHLYGQGPGFLAEVVVVAHWMAEKFAWFPGPELVHSCWAAEISPLGTGEMRLVGRYTESGRHWQCKAWSAWCLHRKGHGKARTPRSPSNHAPWACSLDRAPLSVPSTDRFCSRNKI